MPLQGHLNNLNYKSEIRVLEVTRLEPRLTKASLRLFAGAECLSIIVALKMQKNYISV